MCFHIPSLSSISGGEKLLMEDYSGMSSRDRVFIENDNFKSWRFFNPTKDEKLRNLKVGEVLIKKFAIIEANSIILPDIEIGEGEALVQYGMTRDDLYLILEKCSILTRKYFYPLFSTYSYYAALPSAPPEILPVVHKIADNFLPLPIYISLENEAGIN
jgi:hypothetical protein